MGKSRSRVFRSNFSICLGFLLTPRSILLRSRRKGPRIVGACGEGEGPDPEGRETGQEEEAEGPGPQEDAVQPPVCHRRRRIRQEEGSQLV